MVALLVLLTILAFLIVDYLVKRRRVVSTVTDHVTETPPVVLRDPDCRTPNGVFFHPHHAWAFLQESGSVRVGVDDLTRVVLGRVDRVDAVRVGKRVRKGDTLFELYHGDRSVAVRSPFDGVVEAANSVASHDRAAELTSDWLVTIRPEDTSVLFQTMMIGERASEWLKRELRRLRVFLATIAPEDPVLAQTMHDGGMPYEGVVEHLNDDDWRKLRDTFFDGGRSS